MARGTKAAIRAARRKGTTGLAWASLIVAWVGGTLASGMWIGTGIVFVMDLFWGWFPAVVLLVGLVAMGLDIFLDGTPNWLAIILALTLPSIAVAATGKLGDKVQEWTGALLDWMSAPLIEWLGTGSDTGLAVACVACSLLMARRVIKKSKGGRDPVEAV